MGNTVIGKGTISFQAEGRLLQELGERLVASPEVALVELIKNSYDADSSSCDVRLEEAGNVLVIQDKGHGMTFDEFTNQWMRIATPSKIEERLSKKYKRKLTGAKGIGRFAVRFLGDYLTLVTIAMDKDRGYMTRLVANFDWPEIDRLRDINEAKINYSLDRPDDNSQIGTTLQIKKLKTTTDFTSNSLLRTNILRIITPLQGLDAGRFKQRDTELIHDPGFIVILPESKNEVSTEIDLGKSVLENYWAKLRIEIKDNNLSYKVWFSKSREPILLNIKVNTVISAGIIVDIRYFPRRKGIFSGKGINGRVAWKWVRDNCGVAVVDHGFRIIPYGYKFDDWLHLDADRSHSERDWRSNIAKKYFPISNLIRNRPADNPALYLPYNFQLVGAVFVESRPTSSNKFSMDLTPSMDREGFLKNQAFDELVEFTRAGIEFLALQDKRELDKIIYRESREATKNAREDVKKAIEYIKQSPTLMPGDKSRLVKAYSDLAERIEEVEEYNVHARQSLINMSLLGVVAGFMTHESKSILFDMENAIKIISSLAIKQPGLKKIASNLNEHLQTFKTQIQYSEMFLNGVRKNEAVIMPAAGQIRHILNRFGSFAKDHQINISWDASSKIKTPKLPPAVYSGILLNLYTNALKAVLSTTSSIKYPKIAIRAWNDEKAHYIEVSDNGVGIPPELHKRIWDPLYTTTSDTGNPLGSGMGLGLTLIKQVVEDNRGKIILEENPPPGYNTCFRVIFPLE